MATDGTGTPNAEESPNTEPPAPAPGAESPPPEPEGDPVDWTKFPPKEAESTSLQMGSVYDPRPQEDLARRNIAYGLIALLWVLVIWVLRLVSRGKIHVSEIKEFAVVLGPIVTLVSAATGFYYGTKSK